MRGYEDDNEEYEEYDEYEEDEEEDGEGEEAVERKPTEEEMEYLGLRQRLKENIRKKLKKDSSATRTNMYEKKRQLPFDNYGSFFGPSHPVIAQRVIQESKSLLENQQMSSNLLKSNHGRTNAGPSNTRPPNSSSGHKNVSTVRPSKSISEVKRKVEKLKDTRDYSFLFSDDAELPASSKGPPPQKVPVQRAAEARSAQKPLTSNRPLGISGRNTDGRHEEKKAVSVNGHMPSRSSSVNGHMPTRPSSGNYSKSGSSSNPMHSRPSSVNRQMSAKSSSSNGQTHHKYSTGNGQSNYKSGIDRSASSSKYSSDVRRQLDSQNGIGPGRPMGAKSLPPKTLGSHIERKGSTSGMKSVLPSAHKPQPSKSHPSNAKYHPEERRHLEISKANSIRNQHVTTHSKPQINKPLKQHSSHDMSYDDRPKKKRKPSEDERALSMIRNMFNTKRYADRSDDDSDMEANFDDIMMEEKRSALIAKKEDEEQLRLIEEEERRERLRKQRKMTRK